MDRKLQVFVSSTFTDLIEERQAAVSAILKAGHMPAGMELFTAANKSQWETITKWIDESDVYMLILGGRYGSVEPISGLSYTELEYDYAVLKGKPLFAIVAKESAIEAKVKLRGTEVVERANAAKLEAFRAKVLSNISTFFEDEKDIRLAVMESLMHLSGLHAQAGWVRASTVVETKSLDEAIIRLRSENARLEADLKKAVSASKRSASSPESDFDSLKSVLEATIVALPVSDGNPDGTIKRNILEISSAYLDTLITGVQSNSSSASREWLFNKVFPKLILHGLAKSEKPSGMFYYKSQLNPVGLAFFSRFKKEEAQGGP